MTTETAGPTIPAQTTPNDQPAGSLEPGHGGRIITALESAWSAIRSNHGDVPQVVMITGTARQLGGDRWGHFGADFWAVPQNGSRASELFIAGELIALGGARVLQTLIHEGAHGVAYVRGIKDTSGDGNRYHNKRFVAIAEEMGLQGPAESMKTHGWTACTLPTATAERYAAVIAELDAAALPYLGAPAVSNSDDEDQGDDAEGGDGGEEKPKKKRAGKRFAIECKCDDPRRLQVSPKSVEDGPIICGLCMKPFEPVDQDDEA
ncbi:hypothetical protein [Streptomyces sp. 2112.2]|uniref:hypothetical protein n=1 Tax=Streptomyces sp. 2112.2 TaxID=1881024 RepID=UPI00115F8575|nr:hypothetical protein [Streptomyces sp. 2112.2]